MRRFVRAVSVAGLAFAGLIGGHAIAYWLAVPDAYHRSTLYAQTGHGYMPSAAWIAVVLGLSALAAGFAQGIVGRTHRRNGRLRRAAVSMMGVQAVAFVIVEVVERLASGAALETLSIGLLVAGVAVQLLVAVFAALLLVGVRKLGAALRGMLREVVAPAQRAVWPHPAPSGFEHPALDAYPVRGPPVSNAA